MSIKQDQSQGQSAGVVVSATNLDIRDLTSATDSVEVKQATGTNLHAVVDSGTVTTVSTVTNLSQQGGVAISLNTGVRDTGTQRVTIATNDVVPVSQSGTWDEVGINDSGNVITTDGSGTAGTPAGGVLTVQGVTSMTPLLISFSATQNVQATGSIAHDSADSGNPVKTGAKAYSPDGTTPGTAVAELDRANTICDLNGRTYVNNRSPQSLHKHLDGTAAYTDESVIADPGDGFQAVITSIIFSSGEAVAINFFLEEGATKIFGPIYLEAVAGRGFVSGPIHVPCTASTAVTLTTSAANDQSFDMDYFLQAV